MWFYNLGAASWQEANAITRALAELDRESIVFSRPQPPPLCLGVQVNCEQVVDVAACRAHGIPIVTSPSRNHAMCLAQAQLELRLVHHRERHPLDPQDPQALRIVLDPFLASCREVGIQAEYKAPDEIVARGRRIARGCQAEIGKCAVFSASLALQFSADSFAGVLNAPDENLRLRAAELVRARRTSVEDELKAALPSDEFEHRIRAHLWQIVGGWQPGVIDESLQSSIRKVPPDFAANREGRRVAGGTKGWNVDIGAGTELQQRTVKAPGGLLRATSEWHNRRIVNVFLAGDFLCYPPGCLRRLETALVGISVGQVAARICDFYREFCFVTPGILPGHWTQVLLPLSLEDYAPATQAF